MFSQWSRRWPCRQVCKLGLYGIRVGLKLRSLVDDSLYLGVGWEGLINDIVSNVRRHHKISDCDLNSCGELPAMVLQVLLHNRVILFCQLDVSLNLGGLLFGCSEKN